MEADRRTTADQLTEVRSAIDALDREIVGLLARREEFVRRAGRLKADSDAVRAPARVEQVISKVRGLAAESGADPAVVEATYRAMIAAFIDLELRVHRTGD
ncbi:chorismate mutase [Cryptosporangium arvum]|uniref:Chorismate mutase n=1 Tax=Cryptosporangium arvum DSM 44712 TaxID=927661 RepID=A0A010ZWE9_9ACTN|nr:chorismate mutase [Cryptosporangium arvum]EXG82994.1 chorismate mutase [Cryptosporangium arvum DSM 44712]